MHEGSRFDFGADFSGLAETPPPPPEKPDKTPEFLKDDDDEDIEEEPKTIRDYFEKKDVEAEAEKEADAEEEEPTETEEAETTENENENESEDSEDETETDESEVVEETESAPDEPEMTDHEVQEAATEILDDRKQDAQSEADQARSVESESEALAAEAFLDTAKNELDQGQPVDEALETAKAKTIQELGLEEAQETEPELPETKNMAEETTVEALQEAPAVEKSQDEEPNEDAPETAEPPEPTVAIETEEAEADDNPPTATAGVNNAQGTIPPIAAVPSANNLPPAASPDSLTGGNVLPTPDSSSTETTIESRRGKGRYLLVGGIVGYMIGRRGGRLRTEKKLLPIQHKLEKEVGELHDKIFWYEASVRNLAHEKALQNPDQAKQTSERLKQQKQETRPETEAEQVVEHKTDNLYSEQFGKVAVENEEPARIENKSPESLKPVDMMTTPELLIIAERIEIEQSNVRRLYETNRLDHESLRRIVRAFLRGERYDQLVHENLLTPEKYAYPEKLSHENIVNTQTITQQYGQTSQIPTMQTQDPAVSQSWQNEPVATPSWIEENSFPKKRSLTGAIIIGVVIALLIVVFVIAR